MKVPNGYKEVVATYGNPQLAGKLNEVWRKNNIISVVIPFPMRLSWDTKVTVNKVQFHKLAADSLTTALTNVWNHARTAIKNRDGYDKDSTYYDKEALKWLRNQKLDLFGGTFNFRPKRTGSQLSMHSFGIAIDINPAENQMGHPGNMPEWYVKCFEDAGFKWGGDWQGRGCDPMHWQLATGC